jgi:site-specific DNA recombinase
MMQSPLRDENRPFTHRAFLPCKGKCPDSYVWEEVVAAKFSDVLARLNFNEEVHRWIAKGLHASLDDERKEHDAAIARLQAEHDRLAQRLRPMYVDKIEVDLIPSPTRTFPAIGASSRTAACARSRRIRPPNAPTWMKESHSLAWPRICSAFDKRPMNEKRRLLNFVLSNSVWTSGELVAHFRKPSDLIAEKSAADLPWRTAATLNPTAHSIWWARQDSNLQPDRYERPALTIELQAPQQ